MEEQNKDSIFKQSINLATKAVQTGELDLTHLGLLLILVKFHRKELQWKSLAENLHLPERTLRERAKKL